MKYAVIRSGGKQYKVEEGQVIEIERLPQKVNESVSFADVLLYVGQDSLQIGKPVVSSVSVKGTVVEVKKGEKIKVSKFKSKVRYRKTTGHRQSLTQVRIEKIEAKGKESPKEKKK